MGATTFYFRKVLTSTTGRGGELQIRYLIDDGAVFYLKANRSTERNEGARQYPLHYGALSP
ncbi:MAG: hypothetical protein CM1200mP29_15700 [Verrucomicrobiota bacterium]|nr:MAG: hypothetical protein CM1200mP29_15700 [Verrucomicrobiota bacterium]